VNTLFFRRTFLGTRALFFIALSIGLLINDYHHHTSSRIRTTLALINTPIQYTVDAPMRFFSWIKEDIIHHHNLLKENRKLKVQQLQLQAKVQQFLALQQENKALRALLQSSKMLSNKVLVSQLLSVSSNPDIHQVTINKGKRDHAYVGQPVLDAHGIYGQVIEVFPSLSRVLLISDPRNAIPVTDVRSGVRGIVTGTGNDARLRMIHTAFTSDIQTGDQLLSSGLGGRYPSGYPVGIVKRISYQENSEFANIEIEPAAKLNRGRLLLLVRVQE